MNATVQPKLFEKSPAEVEVEKLVLYALGDFQSRGKVLVDRELAFDRLRGAFLRAFEKFAVAEMPDKTIAEALSRLGARIVEVPNFVAKHPYRVVVPKDVAEIARTYYSGFSKVRQHRASN